jgi:hypothetical protein
MIPIKSVEKVGMARAAASGRAGAAAGGRAGAAASGRGRVVGRVA